MGCTGVSRQTLLVADYAGLELAVQGDLCLRLFGDSQIVTMYDAQLLGEDMHSNNARNVFGKWLGWKVPPRVLVGGKPVLCTYAGETVDAIPAPEFKKHPFGKLLRDMIKAVFYGLAYGKGAYGFSTLAGPDGKMIGEVFAGQMVDALLNAVPGMRKWFQWVEDFVRKHHGIYSLGGRWCDLSREMAGDEWQHRRAFRRAYNFPCQSTGADIIGDAMVKVSECAPLQALGYRTILQVHDELVLRGPLDSVAEAKSLLVNCMKNATANGTELLVDLQVSAGHGDNYLEAK